MIPSIDPADRELAATLHLLTVDVLRGRVESSINVAARGINFSELLAQSWTNSERALIETACTLWGRMDLADAHVSSLLYTLDDANFARVLEAMRIRRGPAH